MIDALPRFKTKRVGKALCAASILMILLGLFGLTTYIMSSLLFNQLFVDPTLIALANQAEMTEAERYAFLVLLNIDGFVESIFALAAGIVGLVAAFGRIKPAVVEIMAIISAGLALLSYCIYAFTFGFENLDIPTCVLMIGFPILLGIAAKRERIKQLALLESGPVYDSVADMMVDFDLTDYHCSVEVGKQSVSGNLAIPLEKLPAGFLKEENGDSDSSFITASFEMVEGKLSFESEDPRFSLILEQFERAKLKRGEKPEDVEVETPSDLYGFLSFIMSNDALLLMNWRDRINLLEELASKSQSELPRDFDTHITDARNSLHALRRFYQQLEDICQIIATSDMRGLSATDQRRFEVLGNRAHRFAQEAEQTAEYAMQVRSLRQAKTAARQTDITTVLTVVATVCMSVSLVTGWYGMNLESMPERYSSFSYLIIIGVCILVVTAELVFFKRKKWF